jgi:hypothetical protein
MLRPTYFGARRSKPWCALVVLVSVCSLTISLATRYSSSWSISSHSVRVNQTHASPDAKRQRLTKNAANWMPPVFSFAVLQAPRFYPQIVSVGATAPNLLFEEKLFSRPPPLI